MQASGITRSWIGALAYAAGVVRGSVDALAAPMEPTRRHDKRGLLLRTIRGQSKRQVARLLGLPRAAEADSPSVIGTTIWIANTWYYPFDAVRETAVAVRFDRDRVVKVEFIGVGG